MEPMAWCKYRCGIQLADNKGRPWKEARVEAHYRECPKAIEVFQSKQRRLHLQARGPSASQVPPLAGLAGGSSAASRRQKRRHDRADVEVNDRAIKRLRADDEQVIKVIRTQVMERG